MRVQQRTKTKRSPQATLGFEVYSLNCVVIMQITVFASLILITDFLFVDGRNHNYVSKNFTRIFFTRLPDSNTDKSHRSIRMHRPSYPLDHDVFKISLMKNSQLIFVFLM